MPTPVGSPRPAVKLEPASSPSFPTAAAAARTLMDRGPTVGGTARSSTSELVSLLSADDFVGASDPGVDSQSDFGGGSAPSAGRSSVGSMEWTNSSSSVDWETTGGTILIDELRPSKSASAAASSRSSQTTRNSFPATAGGIKTEPSASCDDAGVVGLVAEKPPITVKLSRRVLKPSPQQQQQRRSGPADLDADRAAAKERARTVLQGSKLSSSTAMSDVESLDCEVDSLTSAAVGLASSSCPGPGRLSASPRLPGGGGTGPPGQLPKPGDKRPRVGGGNKLTGGTPAEKKQRRNDDGRKMSRKIYEFDEDNDVFVSAGGGQSTMTGKISTIKITKSEGRLQIQKPGAAMVSPGGSRPVHKSVVSSASGQVSGSAVRLGRPPGFPLRPVVRSKSLVVGPKSDAKAAGLPVARMKSSPAPVVSSGGGIMSASSSFTKPAVANTARPSTSSTAAAAKPRPVQPVAKKKGSLSAVIEKLSKGVSAGAEADKKVLYDDVRLAIIREGNKPSTPTREMSSSSSSSKSSMSAGTKRPEGVKESSVRLTAVPVRKQAASQVSDVSRSQAGMVRFTAPPASPPLLPANDQRPVVHSLQSQSVPKIPREQTYRPPAVGVQSVHPGVAAVARVSEVEVAEAGVRGMLTQPSVRTTPRPCAPLPTKSSPAAVDTAAGRMKTTPDAVVGRGVDATVAQSGEAAEEAVDQLHSARHFMDAMSRGSSRVCESGVVVERRLSPPRSPSPSPLTTVDVTKPTVVDTTDASCELGSVLSAAPPQLASLPVDLSADRVGRQPDAAAAAAVTSRFRPPSDASLRSPPCSPVTSLIIDCFPGSPVLVCASNATSSPVAGALSDSATSLPSDAAADDLGRVDRRQSASPGTSVGGGDTAASDIDDDLMNEALMMSADIANDQHAKL